jgi:hypothetical protein
MGIMRLFVRVEGHTPFSLILQDNLLPQHYEEIAADYFKKQWASSRQAPTLVLIRRVVFKNSDQMMDFRKRSGVQQALPDFDALREDARLYDATHQVELIKHDMIITNPPYASLGAHCETELHVKSVSLNRLIMKMTDPTCSHFLEAVFWLTYRTYATPAEVLSKLIQRYDVPHLVRVGEHQRSPIDAAYHDEVVLKVRMRVFHVLARWVDERYFDFADDGLYRKLAQFVRERVDTDGMPAVVLVKMKHGDRSALSTRAPTRLPGVVSRDLTATGVLSAFQAKDIANQLTLLTLFVHDNILPSELLGRQWQGANAAEVPNFLAYRDFINRVSNWVSYAIVSETETAARVNNMAQILLLCDELLRMSNWDMLVAVYGGISDPSVARLTMTASALPEEAAALLPKFEELLSLRGASKVLKSAMANSARPRFMNIVVHLRDLLHLEDTPVEADGMVNFLRCIQQYNLVTLLLDGKGQRLEYVANPKLQGSFSFHPIVPESELAKLSQGVQAH